MLDYLKTFILLTAVAVVSGVAVMKFAMYQGGEVTPAPNVTGQQIIPALERLDQSGLYLKVVRLDYSTTTPKDRIISQQPAAGDNIKKGRDVRVVISRGSKNVIAPDLIGSSLIRAESILSRNSVKVRKKALAYSTKPERTIIAQKPAPHSPMLRGDAITLLLSAGPAPRYIGAPDFVHEPVKVALSEVKKLDLRVSRVTYKPSEEIERGHVVSQDPPAGARMERNSFVALAVSEGSGEESDQPATFSFLYYTAPDGPASMKVALFLENADGEKEIYNRVHRPGETVSVLVAVKGKTAVKIFVDNELTEVRRF